MQNSAPTTNEICRWWQQSRTLQEFPVLRIVGTHDACRYWCFQNSVTSGPKIQNPPNTITNMILPWWQKSRALIDFLVLLFVGTHDACRYWCIQNSNFLTPNPKSRLLLWCTMAHLPQTRFVNDGKSLEPSKNFQCLGLSERMTRADIGASRVL